jgi:hypothetical protein
MAGAEPFLRLVQWKRSRRVDGSSLRALGRFLGDMRGFPDHLGGWIRRKLGAAPKPDSALRNWRIHAVHDDAVGPIVNHLSVDPCLVQISTRKNPMPTKNRFTYTLTMLNIAFLTFGEVSCTSSPTTTNAQRSEQQIASTNAQPPEQRIALLQKARTQELEYLKGLEKTIREEKRNEAWAAKKESELRSSFSAEKGHQNDVLKSVECRSSKCDLQFQVSEGKDSVEQRAAINQWIAATQPCGYTMTPWPNPEQPSAEIRAFLNCGEQ